MNLPAPQTVVKAVLMTAVALVVINMAKPLLPASIRNLLSA